jgi:hypothetical protein
MRRQHRTAYLSRPKQLLILALLLHAASSFMFCFTRHSNDSSAISPPPSPIEPNTPN